jgi:hypothetical protein
MINPLGGFQNNEYTHTLKYSKYLKQNLIRLRKNHRALMDRTTGQQITSTYKI